MIAWILRAPASTCAHSCACDFFCSLGTQHHLLAWQLKLLPLRDAPLLCHGDPKAGSMKDQTATHAHLKESAAVDSQNAASLVGQVGGGANVSGIHSIVIAATFTADPFEKLLKFWMSALDISAATTLSPYAQIMQQ